jgi:hypothetical protein
MEVWELINKFIPFATFVLFVGGLTCYIKYKEILTNGNIKSVILEKLPPQPKKPKPVKPPKKLKWRQLQRRIRNAAYDAKVANAANGVADGCSCNL